MSGLVLLPLGCLLLFPPALQAARISILEVDINSYQVHQAVQQLKLSETIETRFFTAEDLQNNPEARAFIAGSSIVVVNVMALELADYMVSEKLMAGRAVYALNRAWDPKALAEKGYLFDAAVLDYYHHQSVANMVHMVRMAVQRHIDPTVTFKKPEKLPEVCIHHPDARENFRRRTAYLKWYDARTALNPRNPWVGILFYSTTLKPGQWKRPIC